MVVVLIRAGQGGFGRRGGRGGGAYNSRYKFSR